VGARPAWQSADSMTSARDRSPVRSTCRSSSRMSRGRDGLPLGAPDAVRERQPRDGAVRSERGPSPHSPHSYHNAFGNHFLRIIVCARARPIDRIMGNCLSLLIAAESSPRKNKAAQAMPLDTRLWHRVVVDVVFQSPDRTRFSSCCRRCKYPS
jgi:hypothetical protein